MKKYNSEERMHYKGRNYYYQEYFIYNIHANTNKWRKEFFIYREPYKKWNLIELSAVLNYSPQDLYPVLVLYCSIP